MINKYIVVLFLVSLHLLINLPSAISKPFYSKGEPREALSSQYMLQSNNWLIAKRYGDEIQSKPPFSHWLTAISSLPTGKVTEFTSRLPALFFSLITIIVFFSFLFKHTNQELAFVSTLILIISPEWLRASQTSRVDMTLAGCQILAILSLYNYYLNNLKVTKSFYLAIIFLSCAFLTKGPVGVVLPLFCFGLFLLFKKVPIFQIVIKSLLILTLASLTPLIWYYLAYQQMGDKFLDIVFSENFQRFSSTMSNIEDPHEHSFIYLYSTLILGLIPFSVYFIFGIKELFKKYTSREIALKFYNNPILLYFGIITISYILFFSIPSSKRSVYLLPIYPLLAFFLGVYFQEFHQLKYWRIISRIYLGFVSFLAIGTFIFLVLDFNQLASIFNFSSRRLIEMNFYQGIFANKFGFNLYGLTLILLIVLPLAFKVVINKFPATEARFLVITYSVILVLVNTFILPEIANNLSTKNLAQKFELEIKKPGRIYTYGFRDYALNFYLQGHLQEFSQSTAREENFYLIFKEDDWLKHQHKLQTEFKLEQITADYFSFNWPSKLYRLIYCTKITA